MLEKIFVPLLESLSLFCHENPKLRLVLLAPGLKILIRILREDCLPLIVQAKAANCVKVLGMGATEEDLQHPIMQALAESDGLAVLLRSGKKYASDCTPLCLEFLSAFANLFHCTTIRDTMFGMD